MKCFLLFLCCLPLLIGCYGCDSHEQENNRLREEVKMLREQNEYAQAEIVGLKKELAELSARVKDERETLQKTLAEERSQMQDKIEDVRRENAQKKAEADRKRAQIVKKAPTRSDAAKNGAASPAASIKKAPTEKNSTSAGDKAAPRNRTGKTPAGESPNDE